MYIVKTISNQFYKMKKLLWKSFSFIFIVIFFLSGCSSHLEFPSVNNSASSSYTYGQVVWRDLVTPNPKEAADFYKKVFGWTSSQIGTDDQQYWIFKSNGKPVAGMFFMANPKNNAGGEWIPYYSVNSVEDIANKCKSSGGKIAISPKIMEGRGKAALLSDPQGALFAVIKSDNGDPDRSVVLDYDFLWSELWSNDMSKSSEFYKSLFNSQIETKKDDNRDYTIILNSNKPSSGIIQNPVEKIKDYWIQYLRVSDVAGIEKKAKEAGANILIPVDSTIRNGSVCIFLDPTGAPIAVQKWDK